MLPMTPGAERMTEAMRSLEAAFLIGVDGVTEIWLVRHADCYQDMSDGANPALSSLGRRQAELLAKRLRELKPAAVYSSPYGRSLETARAITDDVRVDERLIEMKMELSEYGRLEFNEVPTNDIARMGS